MTSPYTEDQLQRIATSLHIAKASPFIAALVKRATQYQFTQDFIANNANTESLRKELKGFKDGAEEVLATLSRFAVSIERLSENTKPRITPLLRLQENIRRCIGTLTDSINNAKRPVSGKRGNNIDTIRDDFLIELYEFYNDVTGLELKVRSLWTDHPRTGDALAFLFAATEELRGFENLTPGGIEKAMERALKRRHKSS
jgi:hypothetical protein